MQCPVCRHDETSVVDSRTAADGSSVRRRRECDACQFRFSTSEEIELMDLTIVKRDGRREGYARDKIERGLRHALEKRPVTESAFRGVVHEIERDIQHTGANELTSKQLGEIVMERLKHFDKVAYIRFASVYRNFEDVESFTRELDGLA